MIGKNTRLRYYLNNIPSHAPEDIESTEIIADFSEENVQANITANAWTFYGEDAAIIRTWKDDGKIYDGLPFKIEAYNNLNNVVGFDGLLDLTDNYQDNWNDSRRVTVNMKKAEGLNIFFDQLGALSFAYLESKGVFTLNDYQDCDYVVEKKINLIEEMMNGIILFLMLTELIDQIKQIAEEVENLIAHATGGATGSIAATLLGVAKIAIKTAYALSILVVILDLGKQLFETFSPPLRTHKTLNLRVAMTKVCDYLGYGFNSDIDDTVSSTNFALINVHKSIRASRFLSPNPGAFIAHNCKPLTLLRTSPAKVSPITSSATMTNGLELLAQCSISGINSINTANFLSVTNIKGLFKEHNDLLFSVIK